MKIFLHFQIKSGRMDGSSLLQNLTGSHRVCFLYYRHTFDCVNPMLWNCNVYIRLKLSQIFYVGIGGSNITKE